MEDHVTTFDRPLVTDVPTVNERPLPKANTSRLSSRRPGLLWGKYALRLVPEKVVPGFLRRNNKKDERTVAIEKKSHHLAGTYAW